MPSTWIENWNSENYNIHDNTEEELIQYMKKQEQMYKSNINTKKRQKKDYNIPPNKKQHQT